MNLYHMDNIKKLPPLEHLRSFVVFVESPNISKAAESLQISQPLLTQHLKALEEEMGEALFQFEGRKKVLNAVGSDLYSAVKGSLESLGKNIRQTMATSGRLRHVKIGGRKEILETFFETLKFPGALEFVPLSSQETERLLISRDLDIGILQRDLDSDRLIRKKIWSDEVVICWSRDLKVDAKGAVESLLLQLTKHRHFDYGDSSSWSAIAAHYEIHAQSPSRSIFPDWKVLVRAIHEKSGWSILPIRYAELYPDLLLHRLPPEMNQKTQFYIYYQKEFSRQDWFKKIVDQIVQAP